MYNILSKEEIEFYKKTLELEQRYDGRNLTDFREYKIEQDKLLFPNALYGVKISIPNSKNEILIALNGDVKISTNQSKNQQEPKIKNPEKKNFFLEIKSSSETQEELIVLKEIEDLLNKFLLKNINNSKLQLEENISWEIICDIYVIGSLSLNELDYIIKGIRECLLNCQFPNVSVTYNNWNDEYSFEIVEGYDFKFHKEDLPYIFVIGEFKGKIVLDLSKEELISVGSYYIVAISFNGKLTDIEKLDGNIVEVNKLGGFIGRILMITQELIKSC